MPETFPYCAGYQSQVTTDLKIRNVKFTEAGVTTNTDTPGNRKDTNWDVSFAIYGIDVRNDIETFLRSKRGIEAFQFIPNNKVESNLYRCASWAITYEYTDTFTFQGSFESCKGL